MNILELNRMKAEGQKITVMTAYDFEMARIIDRAGVETAGCGDEERSSRR